MKKSLIAMGVLGAFSTLAFASNVTLYGVIEEGVVVSKAKDADTTVIMKSGFDQGSRWGIKGVEELGNGYNVGFILEQGFDPDTGNAADSSKAFSREAFLYVNGGFGKFGFGRTGALTYAQSNVILTGWAFGTGFQISAWQNQLTANWGRMSNVVAYNTPVFGGFSVHAMYSNGTSEDTNKWSENNHYYGLGVLYNANNIKSSLVFEAGDNKGTATKAQTLGDILEGVGIDEDSDAGAAFKSDWDKEAIAAEGKKKTLYAITYGLEYNMGMVTPMFIYQFNHQSDGRQANIFGLSAKISVGGGDALVGARYGFGKNDAAKKVNNWNIGAAYIYPLSKRTAIKAYAGYTDSGKNWKDTSDIYLNGYQVYLGMRHSF